MAEFSTSRIEHLKMIQDVISRMARNSFQLKGWAITLVTAALALAGAQGVGSIAVAGLVPVCAFWLLDAYYLRQERLFRTLFDGVRSTEDAEDFSMDTSPYARGVASVPRVAISQTIWPFYAVLAIATVTAAVLIGSRASGC